MIMMIMMMVMETSISAPTDDTTTATMITETGGPSADAGTASTSRTVNPALENRARAAGL